MNNLPFFKSPSWRKITTPLHIAYGLFAAALFLLYPPLSLFLIAVFMGYQFWNYLIDKVDGDLWESLKDFWECWMAYLLGMAIIGLLHIIGVL